MAVAGAAPEPRRANSPSPNGMPRAPPATRVTLNGSPADWVPTTTAA